MITICGIIGFTSQKTTLNDIEMLKRVMVESRIRGKHASGVAWYDGKNIQSFIQPIAIDELVTKIDWNKLVINDRMTMIAHARYSTSNIQYNQPIVGKSLAVVHNGVITQSDPQMWESQYGYKCETQNDSELILRAVENGDNPLNKFPTSSIAALTLDGRGHLTYMRNSQRPLWMGKIGEGIVYASTYDILHRAGVAEISPVVSSEHKDLQRRNYLQWQTHKQKL